MFTWLVVEDEPDLYDMLLAFFEIYGIRGIMFTNGAEAVCWIESLECNEVEETLPQLALLDIRVPEISGPDIGHCLRQSPILNKIAVVLMTAYYLTPSEESEIMTRAQADALLYKPLPYPNDLYLLLEDILADRNAS